MSKHIRAAAFALPVIMCLSGAHAVTVSPRQSTPALAAHVQASYGNIPLQFEANQGQTDKQVKFLSRGGGYSLFLTPGEAVLALSKPAKASPVKPFAKPEPPARVQAEAVRMKLVGAAVNARVTGEDALPGKVNYFIGNDPKKWRTNIATYKNIRYHSVYNGVDLIYYGNQKHLEYDFVVAPGADPKAIRVSFSGAQKMRVNGQGELVLALHGGNIRWQLPVVYQEVAGVRVPIKGSYVLNDKRQVGFQVASYDRKRPLVIDPVLAYSTYLGGSGEDHISAIVVDMWGSLYVEGYTYSADFPTQNPAQPVSSTAPDIFVAALKADGSALVYSTFLGGNGWDRAGGIAIGPNGNVYVDGMTKSTDFPLMHPIQNTNHGGSQNLDAFVAGLDAGGALIYSTYLGGNGDDWGFGIAVDGNGSAYVTGATDSLDFPLKNPMQAAGTVKSNAFVSKLNAAGTALIYSTYLGNGGGGTGTAIAVDNSGSAYITGSILGNTFPTVNPFEQYQGNIDAFVSKINPAGSALVYSTYLGGSGVDQPSAIAVDGAGRACVGGTTDSTNFPVYRTIVGNHNSGGDDGFVTELTASGNALFFSTYLGGNVNDQVSGIAMDDLGLIYATGSTLSVNFPQLNTLQGTRNGIVDGFVSVLDPFNESLSFSTYLGGSDQDNESAIAVDHHKNIYIGGSTASADFPVLHPFQPVNPGGQGDLTGVVTKISTTPVWGDFNADNKVDLVMQFTDPNNRVAYWYMDNTTLKSQHQMSTPIGPGTKVVAQGDFDGDGYPDLVLQNPSYNYTPIWTIRNGEFVPYETHLSLTPPAGWRIAAAAAFNPYGTPDLVLQDSKTNKIAIWYLNHITVTGGAYTSITPATGWDVVAAADFNRDNRTDLVLQNETTNKVAIWYMNGAAVTGGVYTSVTPSAAWAVVGADDLDGDGKTDLVLQNAITGKVAFWYMNGATVTGGAYTSAPPPTGWKVVGPR